MARKTTNSALAFASAALVVLVLCCWFPRVGAQTTSSGSVAEEAIEECPAEFASCQDDPVCVQCAGGVTLETEDQWQSCLSSVSTNDICTGFGITLCCLDEMTPGVSCMANEAFLRYYECIFETATHEGCSDWSCSEIGVSILSGSDTTDTMTNVGGGGELSGITISSDLGFTRSPAAAPVEITTTDDENDPCLAEFAACQEDSACFECSGAVTDETAREWDSCLKSVFTEDLCNSYGVVLCCMDALSTNDCMLNEPFIGYYNCTITTSTGDVCLGWSCSEIGASIGVIDDDDDYNYNDSASVGGGELSGIASESLPAATLPPFSSTQDPVGPGTGVAVSGQKSTRTRMRSIVVSIVVAVVAGYTATATLG
eukprot:g11640.t1